MAAKTVTIEEAQGNLAELIENANAGDEVILAKGDEPVAKLVALPRKQPTGKPPPRTVGDFRGRIRMADDFNDPLPDEFWGFDKPLEP
ncbi:MAG: type II toxin-antitoxin system Phd/YefM family antitoxin [Candidatus Binatia bacterium]